MTGSSQPSTATPTPGCGAWSLDEILASSFELASFLHPRSEAAVEITAAVLAKLRVAAQAQRKRRSYLPAFRRTRLTLGEVHLAQRLVLIESEPFERLAEDGSEQPPDEAEMVVRYLKHLVRIAWKRNSLYAVVATARILCRYSTEEAALLYGLLCQDPERLPDDDYLRSRKKVLMAEVRSRFDGAVEVILERRGEQRLQAMDDPTPFLPLVRETLERLTPWATPCPVPARFDPFVTSLPALADRGGSAAAGSEVELRRLHAVHHPACLEALTGALGMLAPAEVLALPLFRRVSSRGGRGSRARLPGREEKQRVHHLLEAERRRQRQRGRFLQIAIDGRRVARFDRALGESVELAWGEGSEAVEVRAEETGALLAWCPLAGASAESFPRSLRLAGGGEVTFLLEVGPAGSPPAPAPARRLQIRHRPGFVRALLRRGSPRLPVRPRARLLGATAAALLAVAIALLARRDDLPRKPVAPEPAPARPAVELPAGEGPATLPEPPAGEPPAPAPASPEPRSPAPSSPGQVPAAGAEGEATRGLDPAPALASLAAVRRLYVEPFGEGEERAALRAALVAELAAREIFALTDDRGAADAVLKPLARPGPGLAVGVVDAAGTVLWAAEAELEAPSPGDRARLWAAALAAAREAAGKPRP